METGEEQGSKAGLQIKCKMPVKTEFQINSEYFIPVSMSQILHDVAVDEETCTKIGDGTQPR